MKFIEKVDLQRWIRFVTVLGYIFFVSLPAISLSIYYIYIWDPGYINKFPPEVFNSSNNPVYIAPVIPVRPERDTSNSQKPSGGGVVHDQVVEQLCPNCKHQSVDLATILAEGGSELSVVYKLSFISLSTRLTNSRIFPVNAKFMKSSRQLPCQKFQFILMHPNSTETAQSIYKSCIGRHYLDYQALFILMRTFGSSM
ncbi:unnamed protein product [Cylicostephanus goldi]|uniref:Uncharacterized protein n=1 Tax=Cylicostephanus goldi TaxID=71465 RepID=A0A3P6QIL0_CYLGO|nr:unnamed protein product [Cylicostephanus goldi]